MERYSFIILDTTTMNTSLDVQIYLDEENNIYKFYFKRDNIFEYQLKGYFVNVVTNILTIEWLETIKNENNEIISYINKSLIAESFSNNNNLDFIKQCINKIIYNELNYKWL